MLFWTFIFFHMCTLKKHTHNCVRSVAMVTIWKIKKPPWRPIFPIFGWIDTIYIAADSVCKSLFDILSVFNSRQSMDKQVDITEVSKVLFTDSFCKFYGLYNDLLCPYNLPCFTPWLLLSFVYMYLSQVLAYQSILQIYISWMLNVTQSRLSHDSSAEYILEMAEL
jgi:hypothetical protein